MGESHGTVAVVGWGSTFGPIYQAVTRLREAGLSVSHIHVRHLNPFPENLGELLEGFELVLVPEMNNGQLVSLLRSKYLIPAEGINKVSGKPFKVSEIENRVRVRLEC